MTKDLDFTQGSISKKILLFSLPLMAGNIFQQLYNVVDRKSTRLNSSHK